MVIGFLYKPFDSEISFKRLFRYWLVFLIIGIALMQLITPLSPKFVEREKEITSTEQFCAPIHKMETIAAPILETLIFFILPWKWKGKKGAIVGISIWIILHMISLSIPIAVYITCMGYFFYRCLEIGRWKEIFIFHFIPNTVAILTCFL